ncbi:AIR synthase-related protein, partial [Acinetobacter pecorum]
KPILELLKHVDVHAMAHITGGGLPGNLPRVLPNGAQALVNESSWEWPELFKLLQREGGVEQFEMYRTFNCGVGMVLVVDAADADKTVELLNKFGEKAWAMGQIQDNAESVAGADEKIRVIFA